MQVQPISLSDITTSHNPRNPAQNISDAFAEHGIAEDYTFVDFVQDYALSDDPERRAAYCTMIEEYESYPQGLLDLANSRRKNGALQQINVRVFRTRQGEEMVKRYGIISGERRYMAAAYNYAKHGDKPEIACQVQELTVKEGFDLAIEENLQRKNPTDLEYAKMFDAFKQEINPATDKKFTLREIAEKLTLDYQFVRGRHGLIFLTDAEKRLLMAGKYGLTNAIAKGLANKAGRSSKDIEEKKANRRRVLTLKETEALFDDKRHGDENYLTALADVMRITLNRAMKESDSRLAERAAA
jgi:ParB-like chromosome segregation protein Spo0J